MWCTRCRCCCSKKQITQRRTNAYNTTRRRENREEEVRCLYHLKLSPRRPISSRFKTIAKPLSSQIFNKTTRNNQKTHNSKINAESTTRVDERARRVSFLGIDQMTLEKKSSRLVKKKARERTKFYSLLSASLSCAFSSSFVYN